MDKSIQRTILLILAFLPACMGLEASAADTLTLAVHPYLPAKELTERFAPLAEYLGRETGIPVTVRVGRDYQEHIDFVGKDQADIAYMGPAPYITMVAAYGKKPLLTRLEIDGQPRFLGHIIVKTDSPMRRLADLRGKRFAFGDRDSTMSHLVPQYMLEKAGVSMDKLAEYRFLGSHNNVALGVLAGDFDAGAVKDEVYIKYMPQGLRSLADTPYFSEHLFVARTTLPPALTDRIRQAMLGLGRSPDGAAILKSINPRTTALVTVTDDDYNNLRQVLKALGK
jgi:phosphonate transport system substrate-binding protein